MSPGVLGQRHGEQFTHLHPQLMPAAGAGGDVAPGAIMVPGSPRVLWRMATPRRYLDKDYFGKIASDIHGGRFRTDPSLIAHHAGAISGSRDRLSLSADGHGGMDQSALAAFASGSPLLCSWAATIPWCRSSTAEFWRTSSPTRSLKIIDDGHLFFVTRPTETAELIEAFLAREPSGDTSQV